jgi:glycosyltransferase involved in cell wall biosynthesis
VKTLIQRFLKAARPSQPLISVVIVVHNMQRVAPRTLQSFTAAYQDISPDIYEVIVVENGSDQPLSKQQVEAFGPNFRYFSLRDASPSPVRALNLGVKQSKGRMVALMIDGAHLVTPGVLKYALRALKAYTNPVVCTLALHIGPQLQRLSIKDGYSEQIEDSLLQQIDWPNNGYKLFTISSLLRGTNDGGWFLPISESNCIFLLRPTYDEIGGFDERFDMPGGGLANLDFYYRLCEHPTAELITLLSEASFHQIHGGIATNNADDQTFDDSLSGWVEQYKTIRGKDFKPSIRRHEYWGNLVPEAVPFLEYSVQRLVENMASMVDAPSTQVSKKDQIADALSPELDRKDLALIRASSLFDEAWYLTKNPDVRQAKMDPVLHYLLFGGFEGRDPSPLFNSNYYPSIYAYANKASVNPLLYYLKSDKSEVRKAQPEGGSQVGHDPILVYQMGKVGSTTVEQSLLHSYESIGVQVPIYHVRLLNELDALGQKAIQEIPNPVESLQAIAAYKKLRQKIDENPQQHWNIVSLVRDPVARNIATLFQVLPGFVPDWRERYATDKLGIPELQERLINTNIINESPNQWFDMQIKQIPAFGIDVYAEPFPKDLGYKIYPGTSRARLLVMRLENLNECAERAIYEFLGLKNFTIHNTNVGEEKDYAELYRTFKQTPLPLEYVSKIYDTKLARHFYNKSELEAFIKRWTYMEKGKVPERNQVIAH